MARVPLWWRCLIALGHRWAWVDSHVYEVGRGYETTLVYERCARCGALREYHNGASESAPSKREG